jgi:hypothetical protein
MALDSDAGSVKELPLCDLVMKGGISSGIVYPGLVQELSRGYRFAGIGGSSAGAIAAAVTAAAELRRHETGSKEMPGVTDALHDLLVPGRLQGLFQPTPGARRLFDLLLRASTSKAPRNVRVREAAVAACHEQPELIIGALLLLTGLVALTVGAFGGLPTVVAIVLAVLVTVPLMLLVGVATVGAAFGLVARDALHAMGKTGFGVCPGTRQPHADGPALVDWLHEHIQRAAGRTTEDPPLTFGELAAADIHLVMTTTDLSFARPVTVPDGLEGYLFDPAELRERFPAAIVEHMVPPEHRADPRGTFFIDPQTLPVVVGVRLSLSFPLLLSAIPLYAPNPDQAVMRHLMSDGGICSNFPIHFFDNWMPSWPTFAIDLAEHPAGDTPHVSMVTDPKAVPAPRWSAIESFPAFAGTIKDTAQNWRDTMQSELPAYRDRVCQIQFDQGEGGLYLGMDDDVIAQLVARGGEAGQLIRSTFDADEWEQHRWIRYLTLMAQLQANLQASEGPFAAFGPGLAKGLPTVQAFRTGRDGEWCAAAERATAALLEVSRCWGPPPPNLDFRGADGPLPDPVLRIVARA